MRFSSLLDRTEAKELTQAEASEILEINVRTFQRWAERFEAEGDDGLVDRRMGRRSPRRAVAWAKCDMLATVGFERLDLFHTARDQYGKRRYLHPKLTGADLERVKSGVLHAACDSVT
jgi:hypothetical protein